MLEPSGDQGADVERQAGRQAGSGRQGEDVGGGGAFLDFGGLVGRDRKGDGTRKGSGEKRKGREKEREYENDD